MNELETRELNLWRERRAVADRGLLVFGLPGKGTDEVFKTVSIEGLDDEVMHRAEFVGNVIT